MKCPILKSNLQILKISKYFNVLSASFGDPFHENIVCSWCFLSFVYVDATFGEGRGLGVLKLFAGSCSRIPLFIYLFIFCFAVRVILKHCCCEGLVWVYCIKIPSRTKELLF